MLKIIFSRGTNSYGSYIYFIRLFVSCDIAIIQHKSSIYKKVFDATVKKNMHAEVTYLY